MTKREYAQEIANIVNGTVAEVSKANGIIFTGITRKSENSNVAPTVYIDTMFEEGKSVEDAAKEVERILTANQRESMNLDYLQDFEQVKPHLTARLYNKATKAEVKASAKKYGFEDLIIVPIINVDVEGTPGSIKVTKKMLETWGKVTQKVVIDIALENSAKETEIMSMFQMLRSLMGSAPYGMEDDNRMLIVTNTNKVYGAVGVISKAKELSEMFPDGYTVLPSSVHECIIVAKGDDNEFADMVRSINASQVAPEEQLSDNVYTFDAA